ncbi:MAG: alpha-glucosidase [Clostridia bacterium]|nr:alpha-glucosidase [Clostridia bacterium]
MIRRYDFGSPIPTGAVVRTLACENTPVPFFQVEAKEGQVSFSLTLDRDDMIFGLGENVRGINKRGHLFRAWNSDDFSHTENKAGIYASHNLLLFSGKDKLFGVYFDDPGAVTFDLGYTQQDSVRITSENGNLSVYIIEADSLTAICKEFRGLIGRSYLPPKWAFGYIQSRWGYSTDEEVREIVKGHRDRHIPLDGVCMDIDYMEDYKDFTWDKKKFPDLRGFNDDMRQEHIRLIPIIDAGVKQQDGYDTCEEGLEKGYFVKKADGKPFVGAVWPGRSYFPDFLREDVRQWFGDEYRKLLDQGVEGFWNDMNEPALFYSEESLADAFQVADELRHENLDIRSAFALKDAFANLSNNPEDYKRFYHQVEGKAVRHDKVHNLYGACMTQAAAEGFRRYDASKRFLMFSRASFIGAHRYGGVWQGDNNAWWAHLKMNLQMMPSLNMCGFLYTGADLGGFGCNTTEDLLLRWLQLGVFTPLMRNHAAQGTRDQEAFRFSNWADMRNIITVRYALLPYLYSEFMKAALQDDMLFRPLAFDYPDDDTARRVEDQVMLGADCMIAPVYEQNARGRHVYLPEDMLMVRFRSAEDYDLTPMEAGHYWIELDTTEMPLFIRRGHVIPLAKPAEYVEGIDESDLKLLGWVDKDVSITLYSDDGYTTSPCLEKGLTAITLQVQGEKATAQGHGLTLHADDVIIGD